MTEAVDYGRDIVIVLAGGSVLYKFASELIGWVIKKKNGEQTQTVTINAGNQTNTNGGNGRVYATSAELSKHALDCAGKIHEKINQNYEKLSIQINTNHHESMKVIGDMKVSMARLESMRSPRNS